MSRFQTLDGNTWETFYEEGFSVLVVGKTTCNACSEWSEELQKYLDSSNDYSTVRFGKIYIDKGGLTAWKKASPWLADVTDLPCTLIIHNGKIEKQFYGNGVDRLKNRLDKVIANAEDGKDDSKDKEGGCGCGCHHD